MSNIVRTTEYAFLNPATEKVNIDPKKKRKDSSEQKKPYWIYALALEDGKYYVGLTGRSNPNVRINQHGTTYGARWTMKHKPIKVLEIRDLGYTTKSEAEDFEQNLTWAYMKIYGNQKVRGGNTTYTGKILVIGNRIFPGYLLESAITLLFIVLILIYIISNLE